MEIDFTLNNFIKQIISLLKIKRGKKLNGNADKLEKRISHFTKTTTNNENQILN